MELSNDQKIEIAKDFVSQHKNDNVIEWQPNFGNGDHAYLSIFSLLENGMYGNITDNGEYNKDCEYTEPTEWQVEIIGFEHKSGNPYVFEWEV